MRLTQRESDLLDAVQCETHKGYVSKETAAYLLNTSVQAIGRLALSLSRKGLIYRSTDGSIYLDQSGRSVPSQANHRSPFGMFS